MDGQMGTRIRQLRKFHNMSLDDLAEVLDVSPGFIGLVERNKRGTSREKIEKLCDIFNVSADYLMYGKAEPPAFPADVNGFSIEALGENERRFALEAGKAIVMYRFSESETDLLLQSVVFQACQLKHMRRHYEHALS